MRIFWNDGGRGIDSDSAKEVDEKEAAEIWYDEIRGMEKNFLGLVDDEGRTIQFYFDEGIPDHVDDASDLRIVYLDFPLPEKRGSYATHVTIGEVPDLIKKAFAVAADYRQFGELSFQPW